MQFVPVDTRGHCDTTNISFRHGIRVWLYESVWKGIQSYPQTPNDRKIIRPELNCITSCVKIAPELPDWNKAVYLRILFIYFFYHKHLNDSFFLPTRRLRQSEGMKSGISGKRFIKVPLNMYLYKKKALSRFAAGLQLELKLDDAPEAREKQLWRASGSQMWPFVIVIPLC